MTIYTATDRQMAAALAELDLRLPGMSYAETGYQILDLLTRHEPAQKSLSAEIEVRELSADLLARCHEAGRQLGAKWTDAKGQLPRAVPVPPSVKRRYRAVAGSR